MSDIDFSMLAARPGYRYVEHHTEFFLSVDEYGEISLQTGVCAMPVYKLEESDGEFAVIPENLVLDAQIISIEEQTKPWKDDDGNDIVRVTFRFRIIDEKHHGRQLFGETSTSFVDHPGCKLRAWTCEILGVDSLPANFELDTDNLEAMECKVAVGHRLTKKGTPQEQVREYVTDVMRKGPQVVSSISTGDAGEVF